MKLFAGNREKGNSFLVQLNIHCLHEAIQHFRKNLSWYSGADTKDEFFKVLKKIEKALGDLEKIFLTVTMINRDRTIRLQTIRPRTFHQNGSPEV